MTYKAVIVSKEANGKIGVITFNRPPANAISNDLILETSQALRDFEADPKIVFTVITGKGRFFGAGADLKALGRESLVNSAMLSGIGITGAFLRAAGAGQPAGEPDVTRDKMAYMLGNASSVELMRLLNDHTKVIVAALNGPAVGGSCAWFLGSADLMYVAKSSYMMVPFSGLGLPAEAGAASLFVDHIGAHRTAEFLLFPQRVQAEDMHRIGMANRVFPDEGFHKAVLDYLKQQLEECDPTSILECKRLIVTPLRENRMRAIVKSQDRLSEHFGVGIPQKLLQRRALEMKAASEKAASKSSKL
ncbi:hypothetical protein HDU93_005718 [Gonapodya sp. JEL0774]|nr:hypothetical protein HDU93_005718 [Gonapodya sp. JEL0774]